jgi:lipoprotein-anchoring transpeptidase ErfK/SrfK
VLALGLAVGLAALVPATAAADDPVPLLVPDGVTVGGVDIGGLAAGDAQQALQSSFEEPFRVVVGSRTMLVPGSSLGASARVGAAVEQALVAAPDTAVPLPVAVNRGRVAAWVRRAAKGFDRAVVEPRVVLRGRHPYVTKPRAGRSVQQSAAVAALAKAIAAGDRTAVKLPTRVVEPQTGRNEVGPVIVIRREEKRLWLYRGMRLWRTFGVATGTSAYPTPLGRHSIVAMWRNPWWYPPDSAWARGKSPVPPGPGNPLGTRWMGLSSPGVGIHGTPDPASIGYSASHGCIRMLIPQAEWLFNHVVVGTTVFIVR